MDHLKAQAVLSSPEFKNLIRTRRRLVWPFLALILFAYFAFILAVAFTPSTLGHTLGGVTSIGVMLGIGILVLCFVINGVYLHLARRRIDPILAQIRQTHGQ